MSVTTPSVTTPSTVPNASRAADPGFEERWDDWLVRCREQDRRGRRRVRVAAFGAAVIAVAIASYALAGVL